MRPRQRPYQEHGRSPASGPAKCVACGLCVDKCPQKLPIPERMQRLAELSAELQEAAVE